MMKTIPWCLLLTVVSNQAWTADVDTAARLGLARVQQAAVNWQANEDCFACHHHTLPMLTHVEAALGGLPVPQGWRASQAELTHAYFEARIDDMLAGRHVPGGAATVGYGLWALSLDQRPADDTTHAMVEYLLQIQGVARLRERQPSPLSDLNAGRWIASCRRAPLQASLIGDTVLSLIGIQEYATTVQHPRVDRARRAAQRWLASAELANQQDRLWRLWGLQHLAGEEDLKQSVRAEILSAQNEDGGWGESNELPSDAFSTGQTVFFLCRTGLAVSDPANVRGMEWLLRTQHADGSWLFESHVKPVQPFFDNGDPHGKNQFISVAATAWATAALLQHNRSR